MMKMDSMEKIAIIANVAPVRISGMADGRSCEFRASVPDLEIRKGGLLRACVGSGASPGEAVDALWTAMSTGRIIEKDDDDRTEYAWTGTDWQVVEEKPARETGWAVRSASHGLLFTQCFGFTKVRSGAGRGSVLWFPHRHGAEALIEALSYGKAVLLYKDTLEEVAE